MRLIFLLSMAFIAGFAGAYAMPPAGFWPLIFLSLSGFYLCWAHASGPVAAFACGFSFALGYFLTGLWWVGNALLVEGNEFAWVWPVAVVGLPTLLSLFTALSVSIARILWDPRSLCGFFGFCLLVTLAEWVRGTIFTGFPWNLYGYAWTGLPPMLQVLSLGGGYGLTLLTVLWGAIAGWLLLAPSSRPVKIAVGAAAALSIVACFAYGALRLHNNPTRYDETLTVRVIQPNIPQSEKWTQEKILAHFDRLLALSARRPGENPAGQTAILWPETALHPALLESAPAVVRIQEMLETYDSGATLLAGALRRQDLDGRRMYFNSLVAFRAGRPPQALYDKTHLVPFGEFIPFQRWIPIRPVVEFSGFQPGDGPQTFTLPGLPGFSPLICYEIIFPGDVVDRAVPRPGWIAAITNDAWYGVSAGPHQHFAHARYRAIEEGLPVLRSANTGISGSIDPYGRVLSRTGLYEEASVLLPLPQALSVPTFFSTTGNSLYLIFTGLCVIIMTIRPVRLAARK